MSDGTDRMIIDLQAEIERLKDEAAQKNTPHDISFDMSQRLFADGLERAAVIADDFPGDCMMIAAAIRAEIKT